MHVVREEALRVEDGAESLGGGADAHRLAVLVAIGLDDGVEALLECVAVCGEADDRQDDRGAAGAGLFGGGAVFVVVVVGRVRYADPEYFGHVARVDVVAGCGACVAGDDGEVFACDAERGAAVVGVADRRISH